MYKCAECKQPLSKSEAVIDHIVPVAYGGSNTPSNLRLVHADCNRRRGWWETQWLRFREWLESWKPCPKEQGGYTCHHRIMSNGKKECGEEQNYWKGDRE